MVDFPASYVSLPECTLKRNSAAGKGVVPIINYIPGLLKKRDQKTQPKFSDGNV